jgi:hypothetical protein
MTGLYEVNNITRFDAYAKQLEREIKDIDNNRNYIKACQMATEVEWGDRKNTQMVWRRIQALLSEVK